MKGIAVNEEAGVGEAFQLRFHEAGHGLTPETREMAYDWMVEKLGWDG